MQKTIGIQSDEITFSVLTKNELGIVCNIHDVKILHKLTRKILNNTYTFIIHKEPFLNSIALSEASTSHRVLLLAYNDKVKKEYSIKIAKQKLEDLIQEKTEKVFYDRIQQILINNVGYLKTLGYNTEDKESPIKEEKRKKTLFD